MVVLGLLTCCSPDQPVEARESATVEEPQVSIEAEMFNPGDAIMGCSCIMYLVDEPRTEGACIYAEQVGMTESRFVLMQLNGNLHRFDVDSLVIEDAIGVKETYFSGNGYKGRAIFKEIDRTEPEARAQNGSISLSHSNGGEQVLSVRGICGC